MTPADLLRVLPSVDELCQHVFVRRNARVVRANVVLMRKLVAERIAPLLVTDGSVEPLPVPMILHCPECSTRHIDVGEFATRAHHTHACQHCGFVWRLAIVPTVGVRVLPGFKDQEYGGMLLKKCTQCSGFGIIDRGRDEYTPDTQCAECMGTGKVSSELSSVSLAGAPFAVDAWPNPDEKEQTRNE